MAVANANTYHASVHLMVSYTIPLVHPCKRTRQAGAQAGLLWGKVAPEGTTSVVEATL